jgi:tetratricopeptide (TPR) repeat protein
MTTGMDFGPETGHPDKADQLASRVNDGRDVARIFAEAVRHQQAGRLGDAQTEFRKVLALDPHNAECLHALGFIACRSGQYAAGADLFRQAIEAESNVPHFHLNLGNALYELGRSDEAMAAYQRTLELKPDSADTFGNLGRLYESLGRTEEACRAYEAAIDLAPERALFFRHRVCAGALGRDSALFARMEQLAGRLSSLPEHEQLEMHFALGTAYADDGQDRRAFDHFLAGNALKRKRIHYNEAEALSSFVRIENVFSKDFFLKRPDAGLAARAPIFIVGMPRSGTTLVEQILASHPDVFGAGELRLLPDLIANLSSVAKVSFPELASLLSLSQINRLAEGYMGGLRRLAPTAARIVDKRVYNFMALGLIAVMLPQARIIHLRRDPIDTCFSCFSRVSGEDQLPFSYDLGELGRFYRGYSRLMEHWRRVLPSGMMLEIEYKDLIGDFEGQARLIVDSCGLPWDGRCRDFYRTERPVRTASALQVRQPIYNTAVGRSRRFKEFLGPLVAALNG